jgi:hypothetical protein
MNVNYLFAQVALIVETGEAREVHHMCVLIGYGVDAICPYMVFEIAHMLRKEQLIDPEITDHVVYENYAAAVDRGISKVRRLLLVFYTVFIFIKFKNTAGKPAPVCNYFCENKPTSSVVDFGSGRIDIVLADPDSFQPKIQLDLTFSVKFH